MVQVQSVRGMRDILPADSRRWRVVEDTVRGVLDAYAYEEVRLPLMEYTELFARGVGEATDIVEKEMYSLNDGDGSSLSLRPEGTASCVRALLEHGLLFNQTQRVFYSGPMFRYERPQKGRYRQFNQIGAEVFGLTGPDVDVELIAMCAEFWRRLGVQDAVELQINSLGSGDARGRYRDALVAYLEPRKTDLDEDSQRRLTTNPLRILDSKDSGTREILAQAPRLSEFLDDESRNHFSALQSMLTGVGVSFTVNETLVRGLDYYTHTVFEWVTDALGAQGTVCGGGRYDGLVEQLGGKPTPAAGFGLGVDRVVLLHEACQQAVPEQAADVYICLGIDDQTGEGEALAARLRQAHPGARIRLHMGGGAFKKQLKKADASGARYAVILGQQEKTDHTLTVKELKTGEQWSKPLDQAIGALFEGGSA